MKNVAYLACGCFWGSQALFNKLAGVISTQVGYMGDSQDKAHYNLIKHGVTRHKEVIEVVYDDTLSYDEIIRYFFEIHDFTQEDGQGPDIGEQYKSVIFYINEEQRNIAQKIIQELKKHQYQVATQVIAAMPFYQAEAYHQDYYEHNGLVPYCHLHRPLFPRLPPL